MNGHSLFSTSCYLGLLSLVDLFVWIPVPSGDVAAIGQVDILWKFSNLIYLLCSNHFMVESLPCCMGHWEIFILPIYFIPLVIL